MTESDTSDGGGIGRRELLVAGGLGGLSLATVAAQNSEPERGGGIGVGGGPAASFVLEIPSGETRVGTGRDRAIDAVRFEDEATLRFVVDDPMTSRVVGHE